MSIANSQSVHVIYDCDKEMYVYGSGGRVKYTPNLGQARRFRIPYHVGLFLNRIQRVPDSWVVEVYNMTYFTELPIIDFMRDKNVRDKKNGEYVKNPRWRNGSMQEVVGDV